MWHSLTDVDCCCWDCLLPVGNEASTLVKTSAAKTASARLVMPAELALTKIIGTGCMLLNLVNVQGDNMNLRSVFRTAGMCEDRKAGVNKDIDHEWQAPSQCQTADPALKKP